MSTSGQPHTFTRYKTVHLKGPPGSAGRQATYLLCSESTFSSLQPIHLTKETAWSMTVRLRESAFLLTPHPSIQEDSQCAIDREKQHFPSKPTSLAQDSPRPYYTRPSFIFKHTSTPTSRAVSQHLNIWLITRFFPNML